MIELCRKFHANILVCRAAAKKKLFGLNLSPGIKTWLVLPAPAAPQKTQPSGYNCHGWSATIHRMVRHDPQDDQSPARGCAPTFPRMVTHLTKYGYPPSQGYSPTFPRIVTHLPAQGWSPTIPMMINPHPRDGHPSPTTPRMVTHPHYHPKDDQPPSSGWSSTTPRMVTHPQQDAHAH